MPEKALRYNEKKVDFTRLPVHGMREVAKVWQANSIKYPDQPDGTPNWYKLWGRDTPRSVLQSALRHINVMLEGVQTGRPPADWARDSDGKGMHAANVICNMQMLLEYLRREGLVGDLEEMCAAAQAEKERRDAKAD